MVSKATRDAVMEGVQVREGEYIGFERGRIICSCSTRNEAALKAAEALGMQLHEVALLFFGEDTPAEEAQALATELGTRFPRTETMLTDGGQPVYDYLIVLC